MKNIESYFHFSQLNAEFDIKSLISFVSSHFDQLNRDEFLGVPRRIQYEIISHENLQIESEDSLFEIITEIIRRGTSNRYAVLMALFTKISGDGRQLVGCDREIKRGDPVFLDIELSLFGGCLHTA